MNTDSKMPAIGGSASGGKIIFILSAIFPVVFLLLAFLILCSGCAVIGRHTPAGDNLMAISCFKDIDARESVTETNGTVRETRYRSGVSGEALGTAAGTAGKVLINQ